MFFPWSVLSRPSTRSNRKTRGSRKAGQKRRSPVLARPRVEVLEDRLTPAPVITGGFDGISFPDDPRFTPPDPSAGVGPGHIVETVNTSIEIFDKAGNSLFLDTLEDFFAPVRPPITFAEVFDPKTIFDEASGRFIVTADDVDFVTGRSFILVAVSNSSDPSNPLDWEKHRIENTDTTQGFATWGDFPQLGVDADGIYVTFNMFTFGFPIFTHTKIMAIDKATVLDADANTLTFFDVNPAGLEDDGLGGHLHFTLQPAKMHGANPGDPMFFVEEDAFGDRTNLRVIVMTNKLSDDPNLAPFCITVPEYDPTPVAQQPGFLFPTLDAGDTRILDVAWRDGRLVALHTTGTEDEIGARIRWYEFDTLGLHPTLTQTGEIDQGPGVSSFMPGIDIAPDGSIGVVFMQSSAAEFMSVYLTGRVETDPLGFMNTPILVRAGEDVYVDPPLFFRTGDYSSVAVDPTDGSFWATSEFSILRVPSPPAPPPGTLVNNWGTFLSNFRFLPFVVSQSPIGIVHGTVEHIDFNFSEPMDPSSFLLTDILSFTGPGGVDLSGALTTHTFLNGNRTLRVFFDVQPPSIQDPVSFPDGDYVMVLSSDITAPDDNSPLDQDQDGVAGEVGEDEYIATFTIIHAGTDPFLDENVPTGNESAADAIDLGTGFDFTFAVRAINFADNPFTPAYDGDQDFYRFTAPAGTNGKLVIHMTPSLGDVDALDAEITLFDATGTVVLAQANAVGPDGFETLSFPVVPLAGGFAGGTEFVVRFAAANGGSVGDYDFTIGVGQDIFVDVTNVAPGDGSLGNPFRTLQDAVGLATALAGPNRIFVFGNNQGNAQLVYVWTRDDDQNQDGTPDGNLTIRAEDSLIFQAQEAGGAPAPLVVKLFNNFIDIAGEMRVEGQAGSPVIFTSLQDDAAGGDTNNDGSISGPNRIDWGGIRFRGGAVDQGPTAATGSLIRHADIRFTGATLPEPQAEPALDFTEFSSVRMEFFEFSNGGTTVSSAVQVRIQDTIFQHGGKAIDVAAPAMGTSDANNVITGPDLHSDDGVVRLTFVDNSINGLRVDLNFLPNIPDFTVDSTWDDVGVTYVLTERLNVAPVTDANGNILDETTLTINAGMIVKVQRNEINAHNVGAHLLVDGTAAQPVLFTALSDDVFHPLFANANGGGDTNNSDDDLDPTTNNDPITPAAGDWGGIAVSDGHIDHAILSFGGGLVPVRGEFVGQSPIFISSSSLYAQKFRVSNTEIFQTFSGTVGGLVVDSPAIKIGTLPSAKADVGTQQVNHIRGLPADGEITVIDNFLHDNLGKAIFADSGTFHNRPNPLGGYGVHFRRNVVSDNAFNGLYTDTIDNHGYADDTDIVLTVGGSILVNDPNQVFMLQSHRTVFPINDGHLDRFQGGASAAAAFLARLQSAGAPLQNFLPFPDPIPEKEVRDEATNNTFETAQFIGGSSFSIAPPPSVFQGPPFGVLPTASIRGFVGFDDVDFYAFDADPGVVYFDIDSAPFARGDAFEFNNTVLSLFDFNGELLAYSDDAMRHVDFDGAFWIPPLITGGGDSGSADTFDPFVGAFTITQPGTYYIAVSRAGNDPCAIASLADQIALDRPDGSAGDIIGPPGAPFAIEDFQTAGAPIEATDYHQEGLQPLLATPYRLFITAENPVGFTPIFEDNGLFTTAVDLDVTARGGAFAVGGAADTFGNLTGEAWRDFGIDFVASAGVLSQAGPAVTGTNVLTSADVSNGSFEMVFPNQVSAVGFWVTNNLATSPYERIEFYTENNVLLEVAPLPTTGSGPVFVGRVSRQPIHRILIVEDADDFIGGVFSNNTLTPISDNGVTTSNIAVASSFTISDLNVLVNIDHTRDGELLVELVHDDGVTQTTVTLIDQRGGDGDNFRNTILDDQALVNIGQGSAPFPGSYLPEQPLSAFNGQDAQGTWTLRITDLASGQVGTLRNWQLRFASPSLTPDSVSIDDPFFVEAAQSLVVKAETAASAIRSGGQDGNQADFGGTLRIMGVGSNRVVLTSINDDTAGAGVISHVLWQTNGGNDRFDTNNGGGAAAPGAWTGIFIDVGANSNRIENVTQQPNGTILRRSSDLNPYTIGDEPGSDTDTFATGTGSFELNVQDGTLIEFADIRFAVRGIDYRGYPDGKLSIEGNETELNLNGTPDLNNTIGSATVLPPLVASDLPTIISGDTQGRPHFASATGSILIGGSMPGLPGGSITTDVDFYTLPDLPATYGAVDLFIDVDHTFDDSVEGPVNIWVFNQNNQLIYGNGQDIGGTSGGLGPIVMWAGDLNHTALNPFRDAQFIAITGSGRLPAVFFLPNGPFPRFRPIVGGEGFYIDFVDGSGTVVDNPQGSGFLFGGLTIGGYEMEIRPASTGRAHDLDATRNQDGEVIFRNNLISSFSVAGITHQQDLVAGRGGVLVPAQSARYFFRNDDVDPRTGQFFANPDYLIPGMQAYNNLIVNGQGDGIRISDDTRTALPANTAGPIPVAFDQILNNTVHGNAGTGIAITTRGGPAVLNNVLTNNNVGIAVTDVLDPNSRAVVGYNLLNGNITANSQGTFSATNNIVGVDPQYVDAANGDFRVFFTSPVVDAALSDLSDRLGAARNPDEPTRAPNDDIRGRKRNDNPTRQNVGSGQFPFFEIGAFEASEPTLRVLNLSLFNPTGAITGPIPSFVVTFVGRADPATVTTATVLLTIGTSPGGTPVPISTISNSFDPAQNIHTFTFTLAQPLLANTFCLLLDGVAPPRTTDPAIRDIAGQLLDGEFNGQSLPSGNGVAGGSFLFCFTVQVGSIGDTVFNDLNGNGVEDSGEPGLPDISVNLIGAGLDGLFGSPDDLSFTTQITDGNGNYSFTNLASGLYRVSVDAATAPAGFILTSPSPIDVSLALGENFDDADFGFQERTASIGDFVWSDLDGDTIQDAGEVGIPDVDVDLVWAGGDNTFGTPDDETFARQTTDAGGRYLFTNLPAGLHRVFVDDSTLPAAFVLTTSFDPIDVTVATGQQFLGADFGYWEDFQNASIGDLVWDDRNGNGSLDAGEPGLANVEVTLLGSGQDRIIGTADDVVFPSAFTNATGFYTFNNLPAWRYVVNVNQATVPLPAVFSLTTNNLPLNLSLVPAQSVTDADFGFQETNATISGRVFNDLNGNGVQNGGEPGLNLARVFVDLDNDGVLDLGERFDDTDAAGDYTITQVGGGLKNVRVLLSTLPANFFNTTAHPAVVNVPNGSTGTNVSGVNFGFELRNAFLGDAVFDDQNANGIFDASEAGIPGVIVFVDRDNNGVRAAFEPQGTTNANGIYSMQIPSGVPLFVRVDLSTVPAGSFATTPAVLTRNVAAGATDNTADFGFRLPSTIYFTLNVATTLTSTDGTAPLAVTPRDIVKLTITGGTRRYQMYLQGIDIGLGPTTSENLDAFTFLPNGDILISTVGLVTLPTDVFTPGIGTGPTLNGNGEDIFRFTPTSVGSDVTGSWAFHFDGSDVGLLASTGENVDAISVLADGRILLSTAGNFGANGVTGFDTDLFAFTPISLGDFTAGTFSLFFDGSDVALTDNTVEDIDGLFVREGAGLPELFFSVRGAFAVPGVAGQDEDIFGFRPTTLGGTTSGVYGPGLRFDGSAFGLGAINLLGFFIGTAPGAFPLTAAGYAPADDTGPALPFRWAGADTVNVLLAGSLSYDQASRVRDAMADINVHWQTTGMQFVEVGDPGLADIQIRLASSTPAGGAADGVLGWSSFVIDTGIGGWLADGTPFHQLMGHDLGIPAEVTLVSGWSWYAGADGSRIASDQYDFQSVVVHELGHMIGLDHSDDAASIMADTLATGGVRRQLGDSDRAAIDSLYSGAVLADLSAPATRVAATSPAAPSRAVPLSVLMPADLDGIRPGQPVLDRLVSMLTPPAPTTGAVDLLFAQAVEYRPRPLAHSLPLDDLLALWTDPLEGALI